MSESTHKLNADQTVAVATDVFWNEDMSQAPRGVKLQLLGAGGVAYYDTYNGDPFWIGWCPLPKRRRKWCCAPPSSSAKAAMARRC